jgi:hypothetical protein
MCVPLGGGLGRAGRHWITLNPLKQKRLPQAVNVAEQAEGLFQTPLQNFASVAGEARYSPAEVRLIRQRTLPALIASFRQIRTASANWDTTPNFG